MALNIKLEPFSNFPKIKLFNKVLNYVEREFDKLSINDWTIELYQVEDDETALSKFLSLKFTDDRAPEQIMSVNGSYSGRNFRVNVGINAGGTLPYNLEISINSPFNDVAEYKKAFVGKKWELKSGDKAKAKQLNKLKMPKIIWKHQKAMGMIYRNIIIPFQIISDPKDQSKSIWIVTSGYHRSLAGTGPKIGAYLEAANKLEAFLNELN